MFIRVDDMTPTQRRDLVRLMQPGSSWIKKVAIMSDAQVKRTLADYLGQDISEEEK